MRCPTCQAEIPAGATICPRCGAAAPTTRLSPDDIDAEPRCSVCGGALEDGYISDRAEAGRIRWSLFQSPRQRKWDLRPAAHRYLLVTAYRCTVCGRLELYAYANEPSGGP